MAIDTVWLTNSLPALSMFARRVRAALTGKPYFFNRQRMRFQVFREINRRIRFDNYIETGTFLGLTTHFLANTAMAQGAQVYSCEINERFHRIAGRVLSGRANVHLHHGDSVAFLRSQSASVAQAVNFVYLDAHWYEYLPLRDELSVIGNWPDTIVMIDDFQVPFDAGFGWDKYDDEREICLSYIKEAIGSHPVYFPAYPAEQEGAGIARGYCVIAMSERFADVLDQIPLLKRLR